MNTTEYRVNVIVDAKDLDKIVEVLGNEWGYVNISPIRPKE